MIRRLGGALIAVSFPVAVLGLAIRAAMSHAFLWFEYTRPGFPADQFGFSTDDRLLYGSYGVDYLLNDAGPRYLGDLRFPNGNPVFKPGEVSHMADVKHVIGTGLDVALGLAVLILVLALLLRRHPRIVRMGFRWGAILTILGLAALGVGALTGWEAFFAWVHSLFFRNGTWTFYTDDTLIRLYPEQFWMDAAALIGVVIVVACLAALVLSRGRRTGGGSVRSRRGLRSRTAD
jgi:integral membrane protein (TIGR01906 family)